MADRNWSQHPHVTDILAEMVPIDKQWFTAQARDKGAAVHAATQYMDEGTLDLSTITPEIAGRVQAYEMFLEDVSPKILGIEERIEHDTLGYCGTLDRRLMINNVEGVLDLKPPTRAKWHRLQLSAYADCYPTLLARWTLYLNDNGTYTLVQHRNHRDDRKTWHAMVRIYNWRQKS